MNRGMVLNPRFLARRRLIRRFPTFTETLVPAEGRVQANTCGVFTFNINQLPQLAQYSALYRQYKINWAQVVLIPDFNSYDGNINNPGGLQGGGLPRIAWAVNDTPGIPAPLNEQQLLEDNGARTKAIVTRWSQSCKPVPVQTTGAAANPVLMRYRQPPWLSFAVAPAVDPDHFGISYCISQALAGGQTAQFYHVYYKINFSLRDPQ